MLLTIVCLNLLSYVLCDLKEIELVKHLEEKLIEELETNRKGR